MGKGIGVQLDKDGKLEFVVREYEPGMLVDYQTYKRLEKYCEENPNATVEDVMRERFKPTEQEAKGEA